MDGWMGGWVHTGAWSMHAATSGVLAVRRLSRSHSPRSPANLVVARWELGMAGVGGMVWWMASTGKSVTRGWWVLLAGARLGQQQPSARA